VCVTLSGDMAKLKSVRGAPGQNHPHTTTVMTALRIWHPHDPFTNGIRHVSLMHNALPIVEPFRRYPWSNSAS
jgi:hypothetical protein